MGAVTIRDLRNHGGDVVDRVLAGESLTVTRGGRPVARLTPLARTPLDRDSLIERWARLDPVDPTRLRAQIDGFVDQTL